MTPKQQISLEEHRAIVVRILEKWQKLEEQRVIRDVIALIAISTAALIYVFVIR